MNQLIRPSMKTRGADSHSGEQTLATSLSLDQQEGLSIRSSNSGPVPLSLDLIARDFEQNVPVRNNRYHFKVYRNTFVAREAVDYLIMAGYARERQEAVALGRELCQRFHLFEHVSREQEFKDAFLFYRFIDPAVRRSHGECSAEEQSIPVPQQGAQHSLLRSSSSLPVADWTIDQLTRVAAKLRKNVLVKDRMYHLKKYAQCFVASEAVDFLVGTEIVDRRSDAVLLGRRLQAELGSFHHVVYDHDFKDDYLFFRWKSDTRNMTKGSQSSHSPEAVLDFWLGSMREPADMNEEIWRDRMNQWRVGIFVGGESESARFRRYQKEWCDTTCMGVKVSILDGWETEPYGALAKLIILDQFPRTIYRGTPLAFGKKSEVAALVNTICANKWDEQVYNVVERMWVYMAASQIEDRDMQDLSMDKWAKWSTDMIAVSSKENKDVNRQVGLHFLQVAIERAQAIGLYGRFPHRNPIFNRPNRYAEREYLLSERRAPWTMTQPVDPEFQALHAIFHRIAPGESCRELSKQAIVRFDEYFDLDGELIPVLFRGGKKHITFHELYAHLRQSTKKSTMQEIRQSRRLIITQKEICQIVYQDEITIWPPAFSEIPALLDVPKLNSFIGCPFLVAPPQFNISRRAIRDFHQQSGFQPEPMSMLYRKHLKLIAASKARRQSLSDDSSVLREEAVLDKDHFRGVIGPMLSRNQEAIVNKLFGLVDAGNNKVLDSSELFVAMIVLGSGSILQKAKLTVAYFDTDGDNRLSPGDMANLFEACFLRCPSFLSSLFQDEERGASSYDSADANVDVTVQNIQTLHKAHELCERTFTQMDRNKDCLVELDEFVTWLQLNGDSAGSMGEQQEAKDLFLDLFRLNAELFPDLL